MHLLLQRQIIEAEASVRQDDRDRAARRALVGGTLHRPRPRRRARRAVARLRPA